jgi:hypothetical protein
MCKETIETLIGQGEDIQLIDYNNDPIEGQNIF